MLTRAEQALEHAFGARHLHLEPGQEDIVDGTVSHDDCAGHNRLEILELLGIHDQDDEPVRT